MKYLSWKWTAVLCVSFLFLCSCAGQQYQDVKIIKSKNNKAHFLMAVKEAESGKYYIIDTASDTVIDNKYFNEMKDSDGEPREFATPSGVTEVKTSSVKQLQMTKVGFDFRDIGGLPVAFQDLGPMEKILGLELKGILGTYPMTLVVLSYDKKTNSAKIYPSKKSSGIDLTNYQSFPIRLEGNKITLPEIAIEGVPFKNVVIDTAATLGAIKSENYDFLYEKCVSAGYEAMTLGGTVRPAVFKCENLEIFGEKFNSTVFVKKSNQNKIGMDVLSEVDFVIDFQGKELFIRK